MLPVEFAHAVAGAGVMTGDAGGAAIETVALFVAEHPDPFVTVRTRPTVPLAPAVYVIDCRFVALVIVPLVIDHA